MLAVDFQLLSHVILPMAKNSDKPESASAPAKGRKLDLPALESWLWAST